MESIRLGIVGGGQLGRMLTLSAHSLGIRVVCLEVGGSASPAGQVTTTIDGALSSPEGLRELASRSDVLTVEIEHVDVDALEAAAAHAGIPVHPSPATIRLIQNKYNQKEFFNERGVPVGDYLNIESLAALTQAISVSCDYF
jgi:phosphoribosylaminoimidazole carboxylase